MKLNKILICAVLLTFVAGLGMAFAADSITGTVEQTDAGVVIMADDGTYMVQGQDLSSMVGKKIKATGTVAEGDAGKTITVMSIEEVE